jgi:hypothetical protein
MRYKTGGINGSWTEGAMVMRWMLTGIRDSIEIWQTYSQCMVGEGEFFGDLQGIVQGS